MATSSAMNLPPGVYGCTAQRWPRSTQLIDVVGNEGAFVRWRARCTFEAAYAAILILDVWPAGQAQSRWAASRNAHANWRSKWQSL